ncbi:MAG: ribonuclease III [Rikenellaceae bacterium]
MIGFLNYLIKSNFSKDRYHYKTIKRIFGLIPNNIELYKLAMIHKSASIVLEDGAIMNNERLEFLGDAIIEGVVSDMLYVEYPYEDEGFLTQLRSRLVNRKTLNQLAVSMGLDSCIITQSSYNATGKHLYGDAFEAMMGAIYLDKGYDFTNRLLINRIFERYIDIEKIMETETDHKSRLIEWCQKRHKKLSIVAKLSDDNKEEEHNFVGIVTINGKECGYGIGTSKKEAEQRAAQNTITKLKIVV